MGDLRKIVVQVGEFGSVTCEMTDECYKDLWNLGIDVEAELKTAFTNQGFTTEHTTASICVEKTVKDIELE